MSGIHYWIKMWWVLFDINATVNLLQSLGFTIYPEKSILVPTQEIEFLGFVPKSNQKAAI